MSDAVAAYLAQNGSLTAETTARLLSIRNAFLSIVLGGRPCSQAPGGYSWAGQAPLVSLAGARLDTRIAHEVDTAALPAGLKSGQVFN
jgi:hypothetical protein